MQQNVLIVDDNYDAQKRLTVAFEILGWQCSVVSDCTRVFDMVRGRSPDLIVLDLMQPETNGFETLSRLKANPHTRNVPVIIMSTSGSTAGSGEQRFQRLGASWVIPKGDFSIRSLRQAVNELGMS